MADKKAPSKPRPGIVWPVTGADGDRSSTETSKRIWEASFAQLDKAKAKEVAAEQNWRFKYANFINEHVKLSLKSPQAALSAAKAGLDQAHKLFEYLDESGKSMPFAEAMDAIPGTFETGVVVGSKPKPKLELEVPYKGQILKGQALLDRLKAWADYGTIEPSAAEAIAEVSRNGKWMDLSDRHFVMLGAGSAMGPYPLLMALGANVIAVDLDRPNIWKRLIDIARNSCGKLYFPMKVPFDKSMNDDTLAANAGADLLTAAPKLARWLTTLLPDTEFTIGEYVYLDGEAHVRLVLACDAIISTLIAKRHKKAPVSLAFLCTPTDVHVIPHDAWEAAKRQQATFGLPMLLKLLVSPFSKRMLVPNTTPEVTAADGETFNYVDGIVVAQGPNYALAKRMQHWRAMLARDAGCLVSSHIAPSTSTVSVVSNRQFAWAYDGVPFFKPMEVFSQVKFDEVSHAVMTAILINDLRNKKAIANPENELRNPLELFSSNSFHGGVWRMAYRFGTVGEISVIVHFIKVGLPYLLGTILLFLLLRKFL